MKYVAVDDDGELRIISLHELNPTWTVVGEISRGQEDEEDPLVALVNPYTSAHDFGWPENMIDYSTQVKLSELHATIMALK